MIEKLVNHVIVYGLVNILKSFVPFIMLPILTAYLSPESFGIFSIIEVSILLLFPFISLNISSAINVEYYHLDEKHFRLYFNNAMILSLFSFLFFVILIGINRENIYTHLSLSTTIILFLPVFAFLRLLPQVLLGLFQVQQKVKKFALFSLAQMFLDLVLSYILVVGYLQGYIGRLEGIYIASAIMSIYALVYLYKNKYLRQFTWEYSKKILYFSLPLIPHVLGGVIIAMSDRYFIMYFKGAEEVAYYTVSYQLSSVILLISLSVNQAWSPILYRWLKKENMTSSIVKYTFVLILLFILCGYLIYQLEDLLFWLFVDNKYDSAKQYYGWLLIGFVFQSFYFLVSHFLFFKKKTKILASITFLGAILNLLLNYILIQTNGVMGVAYATAITWCIFFSVVVCINIFFYKRL
jgi:O-antigen/teichoic acid export membrane protein